mgnify:CR=1 FL=1
MRGLFKRCLIMMMLMCVFLAENAHVSFADSLTFQEAFFTWPEQYSGVIDVPGKGPMRYYAQNDPLWGDLVYERAETSSRRPFRDGGCGPTAGAMAVANLISAEELPRIAAAAKQEYSLCSCSLNKGKCNKRHARYVLTSQRDFERFLPLIFGDFATGNNWDGAYSRTEAQGTGTGFLYGIAKAYDLALTATANYQEALQALGQGDTVVAHASRGGAFTNTGHYVLLAHKDEDRLYILDPLCRAKYDANQADKLEIIQPGLVALTNENVPAAQLDMYLIFHRDI